MIKRFLRAWLFLMAILSCSTTAYSKEIIVIDSTDRLPISGATLLSNTGHMLGITDSRGRFELPSDASFPLTLRSIGYEVECIKTPQDTVALLPAQYPLPEVAVVAGERPIRRALWYAREYSTGTTGCDTMQIYSEYMAVSYFVDTKVKGYHSSDYDLATKSVRRYARISGKNRVDSIFTPAEYDDITMLAWGPPFYKLPPGYIKETPAISQGAAIDSIAGEYSTELILQKGNNRYLRWIDHLSNYKNHSLSPGICKLLGMTIDISRYDSSTCFRQNEVGLYNLYDILYANVNLAVLARGKVFKWIFKSSEPLKISTAIELYPVEVTSHSVEEYKKLRKSKEELPFIVPDNVLPEIQAVTDIKSRL